MVKKILKGLAWVVGSVVVVVTITLVSIVMFVDPNDFKDDITEAVQDATGREFALTGDIELSVFPWLGVTLGAAQLGNAQGFGDVDFARVESVDIKVKVLPLLSQRIEMNTLHLRGLQVNLSRTKTGRNNWDDLLASPVDAVNDVDSAAASPTAPPAAPSTQERPVTSSPKNTPPAIKAFAIGGIHVDNAQLRWDDQSAGQQIDINAFSLRTGAIAEGTPIDIELSTQIKVSAPALEAPIKLQGQLTVNPQTQRYQFTVAELSMNLRGDNLPVSPMSAHLMGTFDADLQAQKVDIRALQIQTLGLDVKGELTVQQLQTEPRVRGEINVAEFSPRDVAKNIALDLPSTINKNVLNTASVVMVFSATPDAITVSTLDVNVDSSHLTGHAKVEHFKKPVVEFDAQLDDIDLDEYLPPPSEETKATTTANASKTSPAPLPLAMLRDLRIVGDVRVGRLKVANARVSNIHVVMKANGGQLRLNPLKADLYDGTLDADVSADVRKDMPRLTVREDLKKVNVGALLKDMLGEDKVLGTATVSSTLSARGMGVAAVTKTLNGSAKFNFEDGAIKGVNLGQMIREAYAKVKKKPKPPKQENKTDFAAMSGSVKIVNGVVSNDDLQAKSPLLRVSGKGTVNLPQERIRYRINAAIVESGEGQSGKELAELKSLTIPIKVGGTFDKPKFSLDLGPVLKAKAKEELKRQKLKLKKKAKKAAKKKKEALKKRVEESLKNKLKGLF